MNCEACRFDDSGLESYLSSTHFDLEKGIYSGSNSSRSTINGNIGITMFDNILVKNRFGEKVPVNELWKEKTVVIKVLRQLGCCLCKQEAKMLSDMKPLFDKHNVTMAAIAFEDIDLEAFLESGYWDWDIYLDPEKNVYKAAGLNKVSVFYLLSALATRSFKKLFAYLRDKGMTNSIKGGDLRQLGGTFVINLNGEILYSFRAKKFGQFPSVKEIYKVIGGNPDEINEDFLEEYIYTRKRLSGDSSISSSSILSGDTS
ncbi:hypothetical protein K502DRAFT_323120 [Neoconidiobolus thromboides FSU 785]|nr:hypothetical protein K502DRAFT_323120 [Neoconidiobolus thromboides FSU 785]